MQNYRKEELYEAVKDLLGKEEFEERLEEERKKYGELIDEGAAAMIVVDKLKKNFFNVVKIADLEPSIEVTLYARVEFLGDTREFDGGRVANMVVSDDTGSCILVLWDNDVRLIEDEKIEKGRIIKIINGYVKEGYYGIEINVGRWGLVEIEPKDVPDMDSKIKIKKLKEIRKGIVGIEAKIKKIYPTKIFFTENGERFAATIIAEDKSGERKIILWDEMARMLQQFEEGDTIKICRAYVKNGEIHAGDISSIPPKIA
ncbi:MAG: OB-fold nucleic acid binding domain-containing protein [Candidatus Thermoplasmatota archaeon]|nr:OB-fold nucleic acid binding domain-containing protein [Candidatus Thermoplasmatota archaeon]